MNCEARGSCGGGGGGGGGRPMLDRAVRLSTRVLGACVCGTNGVDDVDANGAAACGISKACRPSDASDRGGASACCCTSFRLLEDVRWYWLARGWLDVEAEGVPLAWRMDEFFDVDLVDPFGGPRFLGSP